MDEKAVKNVKVRVLPFVWTQEALIDEARKFSTMQMWREKSKRTYRAAVRHGWVTVCSSHMVRPQRKYNQDEIIAIAKNFQTRSKFQRGMRGCYEAAIRLGILDIVCVHMDFPHVRANEECRKSVYTIQFWDSSIYIGLSNDPERRFQEHLFRDKSSVAKHFEKIGGRMPIMIIAKNNLTTKDATLFEAEMIQHYKDQGIHVINKAKAGSVGGRRAYTESELIAIAARFSSRLEFQKAVGGAYFAARSRGILDKCCAHMQKPKPKTKADWNSPLSK